MFRCPAVEVQVVPQGDAWAQEQQAQVQEPQGPQFYECITAYAYGPYGLHWSLQVSTALQTP